MTEEIPKKLFDFLQAKKRTDGNQSTASDFEEAGINPDSPNCIEEHPLTVQARSAVKAVRPSILPGSDGEHLLQEKHGNVDRASAFYNAQFLDYLAPLMQEYIAKQETLFVATADRHGECDCTSKFGSPGFIRVLNEKYLIYPEFRGNGVLANLGNMIENPHIAMLIIDFYEDTVALHVNGKARVVENAELLEYSEHLPQNILDEINQESKKQPERWVMVEVEEAYVQCSKHIPLMKKLDKRIDWGTDSAAAKRGDYFQLQDIPLYDRVGGDKAMEVAVDLFYRKVLQDDFIAEFFEDVDMEGQRLKQKSFLSMAFGGPYQYSGLDLRKVHGRLVHDMGLTDAHFDHLLKILKDTMQELHIPAKETDKMMGFLETMRDDVMDR